MCLPSIVVGFRKGRLPGGQGTRPACITALPLPTCVPGCPPALSGDLSASRGLTSDRIHPLFPAAESASPSGVVVLGDTRGRRVMKLGTWCPLPRALPVSRGTLRHGPAAGARTSLRMRPAAPCAAGGCLPFPGSLPSSPRCPPRGRLSLLPPHRMSALLAERGLLVPVRPRGR